jgi:hypothetical protein
MVMMQRQRCEELLHVLHRRRRCWGHRAAVATALPSPTLPPPPPLQWGLCMRQRPRVQRRGGVGLARPTAPGARSSAISETKRNGVRHKCEHSACGTEAGRGTARRWNEATSGPVAPPRAPPGAVTRRRRLRAAPRQSLQLMVTVAPSSAPTPPQELTAHDGPHPQPAGWAEGSACPAVVRAAALYWQPVEGWQLEGVTQASHARLHACVRMRGFCWRRNRVGEGCAVPAAASAAGSGDAEATASRSCTRQLRSGRTMARRQRRPGGWLLGGAGAAREAGDGGVVRGDVAVEALRHGAARHAARDLVPELGAIGPLRLPRRQQVPAGRARAGPPEHLRRRRRRHRGGRGARFMQGERGGENGVGGDARGGRQERCRFLFPAVDETRRQR